MGNLAFREKQSSNDRRGSQLELQSENALRGKGRTAAVSQRGREHRHVKRMGAQGGLERRSKGRHVPSVGAEGCRRRGQALQAAVEVAEVERMDGGGGEKKGEEGREDMTRRMRGAGINLSGKAQSPNSISYCFRIADHIGLGWVQTCKKKSKKRWSESRWWLVTRPNLDFLLTLMRHNQMGFANDLALV